MRVLRGVAAVLAIFLCTVSIPAQKKKKLKLPEILEGHLQSLGAPEKLAGVKSLRASGKGRLVVLVGDDRVLEGESMLTSSEMNFRSSIQFTVSDFPGEDVSFDGKETYVANWRQAVAPSWVIFSISTRLFWRKASWVAWPLPPGRYAM